MLVRIQKKMLTKWNKPHGRLLRWPGAAVHEVHEEAEMCVQPREEEGEGDFYCSSQLPNERMWRRWDQAPLKRCMVEGQGATSTRWTWEMLSTHT